MDYKEVKAICEKYNIQNWTIDDNGLVDVDGNVILKLKNLVELPLQFGKVFGEFDCSFNQLITLDGSPKYVDGKFNCRNNQLTTLKGSPNHVGDYFDCPYNKLTTLEGMPDYIGGDLYCNDNYLFDIVDIPGKIHINYNPAHHIYKYITKYKKLFVTIDYFKDSKILIGRDVYIDRFKAFLDSYGLYSNINVKELEKAGYTIK